jgi:hypothetical protein
VFLAFWRFGVFSDDDPGTLVHRCIGEAFNAIHCYKPVDIGLTENRCRQDTYQAERAEEGLRSGLIVS